MATNEKGPAGAPIPAGTDASLGRDEAGPGALSAAERSGTGNPEVTFRRGRGSWLVAFGERLIRVRDALGLHFLAFLTANPGAEITASELHAAARGDRRLPEPERACRSVSRAIRTALRRLAAADPALAVYLAQNVRVGPVCRFEPGTVRRKVIVIGGG